MKEISVSFLLAVVVLAACKQPVKGKNGVAYTNAIDYNAYIVDRQTEVMKLILKMSDETKTDLSAAEQTLDKTVSLIDKDITEIEGMPDWKGDTALRGNALALFRFYKTAFGNDFRRIIAIQKDGEVTEVEKAEYDQLIANIETKEGRMDNNFQQAQQQFATQNGLPIQKNEIQDKIDQLNK